MNQTAAGLREALERQVRAVETLNGLLEQELGALVEDVESDIGAVARDKQQALDALVESVRAMEAILVRAGRPTDADGLAHCIEQSTDAPVLMSLHERLVAALRACAEHNRVNGAVLGRKRAAVTRALAVLLGQDGGARRYRATGSLETLTDRHSIGCA